MDNYIDNQEDNHLSESEDEIESEDITVNKDINTLPFNSEIFKKTWNKWEQHRKEIKHKLTPETTTSQLKRLGKESEDVAVKIIEQSIENGWTGLFELKDNGTRTNPLRK